MNIGEFKTQRDPSTGKDYVVYFDKEIDDIYDKLSHLKVDLTNKVGEIEPELAQLQTKAEELYKETEKAEKAYEEAHKNMLDHPDEEDFEKKFEEADSKLDKAYDDYAEAYRNASALEEALDALKDLSEKLPA